MNFIKDEKLLLKIAIALFVAVLSVCILGNKVTQTKMVTSTVESLEESRDSVIEFSGALIATSLAISALPNDFATPLANSLSDMNKYLVFVLIMIFLERLIVLEGTKIAFLYLIPIACVVFCIGEVWKKKKITEFSVKLAILSCALILVIPCSVHFTNVVAADYMTYVSDTIEETKNGSDIINDILTTASQGDSLLDKISGAFDSAIKGVSDLVDYFETVVKKCVNSIAILILTSVVMPLLTFLFFKWLLSELFGNILETGSLIQIGGKRTRERRHEEENNSI